MPEVPTPTPQLAKEVYLRIRQKMTVEQCVYFLNNALQIITAAGNFPWDETNVYVTPVGDIYAPLTYNIDLGKKIACFNDNKLPIVRVRQDDYGFAGTNYVNTLAGKYYAAFRGGVTSGTAQTFIEFFPAAVPNPKVYIYHHMIPPVLTNAAGSAPRWINTWMDTVLCDYAEAEIKRILGAPDAQTLEQRARERLASAMADFSVERENSGPLEDVQNAVVEKTQTGRV